MSLRRLPTTFKRLVVLTIAVVIAVLLLSRAASFLVLDDPQPADVILVLAGGNDARYAHAVELQKEGFAERIILDADASQNRFGKSDADLAVDFLRENGAIDSEVCPIHEDSTFGEAVDVKRCLQRQKVNSVLIVTSDFHTRRALSIFRKRLPQYEWSVAAASAPYHFANRWWRHRRWAKAALDEWERYIWWKLVDQWRSNVVLS
ncbi:MAG: YdcF family protein [Candidatus Korobacteraceae bacterium]